MIDILSVIRSELENANIPYEFGQWKSKIQYPYFVGNYYENDYRAEDGCTSGVFTLEGWTRNDVIDLLEANEAIKEIFENYQAVKENMCFFIRYGGAQPEPSGENDLKKIIITLFTEQWKGA